MSYLINRLYNKRGTDKSLWEGRVGHVELKLDVKKTGVESFVPIMLLDGAVLPDASVEYLLNFSLQSLQDAYAGSESLAEAQANWGKKRTALLDGSIGTRSGNGLSEREAAELYVAGQCIRDQIGKDAYKKMTDAARVATQESFVADNGEDAAFIALVDKRIDEAKAAREKAAQEKAERAEALSGFKFNLTV